jgi:hypothetical protein
LLTPERAVNAALDNGDADQRLPARREACALSQTYDSKAAALTPSPSSCVASTDRAVRGAWPAPGCGTRGRRHTGDLPPHDLPVDEDRVRHAQTISATWTFRAASGATTTTTRRRKAGSSARLRLCHDIS